MNTSPNRALIVVDAQNEYVSGELRIEYPPVADSIANIAAAMDAATRSGVPVVVVQQSDPEPHARVFAPGTHGWELHPEIARRHFDLKIDKAFPSAFTGTELEKRLVGMGIDTLTIAGFMTHNCDASTIFHALHSGFAVEFLHDGAGTIPLANEAGAATAEEIHRVLSVVFDSRFAAVLSTSQWIDALQTGVQARPTGILASYHQAASHRHGLTPA